MEDNVKRNTKSDKTKKTKKLYGKYTAKYIRKKTEIIEKKYFTTVNSIILNKKLNN